jgi:peptidoglycan/xylan/chitin deacetylase (PgdA/CDA1 family)
MSRVEGQVLNTNSNAAVLADEADSHAQAAQSRPAADKALGAATSPRGNRTPMLRRRGDRRWSPVRTAKRAFLFASRWVGLFAVARRLTRRQVRILCYHGFALADEAEFRPGMFLKLSTLSRRLDYLQRIGARVLPLAEAVDGLCTGGLPELPVVITIDDGFFSTLAAARSQLATRSLPATLYVTSYYAEKQTPIFRLLVAYMFWKTEANELALSTLLGEPSATVDLADHTAAEAAMRHIVDYGERQLDDAGRCRLAGVLGRMLGVDYDEVAGWRLFNLLNQRELGELEAMGIDIELHTHRHCLPLDEAGTSREVADNRAWLGQAVRSRLEHFCYPSGDWSAEQLPWLAALGVKSAATCDVGLNRTGAEPLALRRWLDDESISQIEFEAEVSGYLELLRLGRGRLRAAVRRSRRG